MGEGVNNSLRTCKLGMLTQYTLKINLLNTYIMVMFKDLVFRRDVPVLLDIGF